MTDKPKNSLLCFQAGIIACQIVLLLVALPLLVMSATMFTGPGVPLIAVGLATLATILGILAKALAPLFSDE